MESTCPVERTLPLDHIRLTRDRIVGARGYGRTSCEAAASVAAPAIPPGCGNHVFAGVAGDTESEARSKLTLYYLADAEPEKGFICAVARGHQPAGPAGGSRAVDLASTARSAAAIKAAVQPQASGDYTN